MRYTSNIKKENGRVSSKDFKKSHKAASAAIMNKIEGKRKSITKHRDEKELSGNQLFK